MSLIYLTSVCVSLFTTSISLVSCGSQIQYTPYQKVQNEYLPRSYVQIPQNAYSSYSSEPVYMHNYDDSPNNNNVEDQYYGRFTNATTLNEISSYPAQNFVPTNTVSKVVTYGSQYQENNDFSKRQGQFDTLSDEAEEESSDLGILDRILDYFIAKEQKKQFPSDPMYYTTPDGYTYPSLQNIADVDHVEISSIGDIPVSTALKTIVNSLGLPDYGSVGNALLLLFGIIVGPIILLGVTIPIVGIVYSALYLPAFGLKSKELVFQLDALLDWLNDANPFGRSMSSTITAVETGECVEQISCQIGQYGRGTFLGGLVSKVEKSMSPTSDLILHAAKGYSTGFQEECKNYKCNPAKMLQILWDNYKS